MTGQGATRPDRAVIDIGSNTVRLVVYAGPQRVPRAWLNESVNARLGRDLATTGLMPAKAVKQALGALARYATIIADLGIEDVLTVATAAVRDAANGAEFLAQVRALGLSPRLLSGEEEARGSAFGIIGAFPGARGTVADLGGGSLELIEVADGACHHGVSLPLGTLRLASLRSAGPGRLAQAAARCMSDTGWATAHPQTLYLVGGTWRAFASFAIHAGAVPLSDPHAFYLGTEQARQIARRIGVTAPSDLTGIPGISASRAVGLPDAAALMRALLDALKPSGIVASSWGLREGLLFQRLPDHERAADPLLVEISDFAEPRGGSLALARLIAAWRREGRHASDQARLLLVSAQLALAATQLEPNLRARHAYEWAMDKRWIGIGPADRAWIAAALVASTGKVALPAGLELLADWEALREAVGWGLTVRLARRLAAGSEASLRASRLTMGGGHLTLTVDQSRRHMISGKVANDLKNLASWYGVEPMLVPAG